MSILEKTARVAAIVLAVLFIGLSLCGVVGAWWLNREAIDLALKGFGVIETGVGVVDAGVGRVDDLITKSRTEVRQAAETIDAVGEKSAGEQPRAQGAERAPGDDSGTARRADAADARACPGCAGPGGRRTGHADLAADPGRSCSEAVGSGGDLQPAGRADRRHDATARDAAGAGGTEGQRRRRDRCRAQGDHAADRHPAGRGADERSEGARRRCGGPGAAGPAQVAAAVRIQPAGAAGHADDGLDRLLAGRRHPAPPGTPATVCRLKVRGSRTPHATASIGAAAGADAGRSWRFAM